VQLTVTAAMSAAETGVVGAVGQELLACGGGGTRCVCKKTKYALQELRDLVDVGTSGWFSLHHPHCHGPLSKILPARSSIRHVARVQILRYRPKIV
jgi:hypothetical protein